ncbi:MAG: aspartate aminotransferase family protein [Anaerolineaceae bacterium]|nr:aspartate aminotransferase family protein [Anaerolineaceae bacterium]
MNNLINIENNTSSGFYSKRDLLITHGKGASLFDAEGNQYIDCIGGQGAANLGHAHPRVIETISQQAARLISCPEMLCNDQRAQLQEKLLQISPGQMKHAFLCNSGTEAVEAAIKIARLSTRKQKIIAAKRGFHGRTYAALSATWERRYRKPFEPLVSGFEHIAYNNITQLQEILDDDTAAVILEIIQGEGGVNMGQREFLIKAQELCIQFGALLIIDEIQTGFGRTGKMFACQHYDIQPDIICLAKSIAGGIPMGAVLFNDRIENIAIGLHGSTFGGNPLACAVSMTVISEILDTDLLQHVEQSGTFLLEELRKIQSPAIREIRGKGLMIGIELKTKNKPFLRALQDQGILLLSAGSTVLRLLPPLVITRAQLERVIESFKKVFEND